MNHFQKKFLGPQNLSKSISFKTGLANVLLIATATVLILVQSPSQAGETNPATSTDSRQPLNNRYQSISIKGANPAQTSKQTSQNRFNSKPTSWEISDHFIPAGSEIVGKTSFFKQYLKYIYIGIGAILIQSIILILLAISVSSGRRTKKRLRNKQQILETVSTNIDVAFALRSATSWSYISKSYNNIFGLDRDDMYKDPLDVLKVTHPDDKEMIEGVNSLIVNQMPLPKDPTELRIIVNGEIRWIEMTMQSVTPENNGDYQVIVIARDITKAKLAELKIKQSEEELATVLNGVTDGVVFLDKEKRIIRVNQAAADFVGITPKDLVGTGCPNPWCTQDDDCKNCPIVEAMATKKVARRELSDSSGQTLYISAQPVINEYGESVGSVVTYSDVTLYKKTEQALRESEELFRTISESAIEAIIVSDTKGNITQWNPAAEKLFGYSKKEALGENAHGLLCPSRYKKKAAKGFSHFRKTGKGPLINQTLEIEALRKDGTECPIEISVTTLEQKGELFTMAVARDVTERINTQKAIQEYTAQLELANLALEDAVAAAHKANEAKGFFLANMSHEIRTPMNGVIGMIELLLDTKLSREQREYAKTVQLSAEALLSLINDILDFSKIEAGQLELESVDFSLRDVVDQVAEIMAIHARKKNNEYISHVHPTLPARVIGDPNRLRQVLINITNNAIKFTENGEVALLVTPKESLYDNDSNVKGEEDIVNICFEVHDTGIGISKEAQDTLFKPFTQEDSSTTRRFGGTGLGLAICKQLTELMGGNIEFESQAKRGTLFRFTIPFRKSNAPIPIKDNSLDIANYRILVVDDNMTNRHLMHDVLNNWGIAHRVASNAEEGLDILREVIGQNNRFDILIVDQEMPDMDGTEMTRIIRQDESMRDIKIIMMSSLDSSNQCEKSKEAGVDLFLTKPVRQSYLFDHLNQLINKPASSDESESVIDHNQIIQLESSNTSNNNPTDELIEYAENKPLKPGKRILIAEDNPINQKVISKILSRLKHHPTIVENGTEAIEKLRKDEFDLVFMDVQMPMMDGYEATRIIRDKSSKVLQPNIPIVAMTAHAMKGDREKCIELGMDDYLCKPIHPKQVREILNKYLNRSFTKK